VEWSRVKNILIVLLAMVNCFLFFVYLNTTVGDAKVDEEFVEHTISVLGKSGIEVESELIPRNSPLLYPVTTTFDDVESFCGKMLSQIGVTEYEAKNLGGSGTGEWGFECTFKITPPESETAAMQIMTKMARKGGIEIAPPTAKFEDGRYILGAQQKLMGIPLCNGRMVLEIGADGSAKLTGAMVSGEATTVEGARPYDVCGLLVGAIGSLPQGEITGISRAYHYRLNGDGIYCVPVWQITMTNMQFFINAMNGEVMESTY